MSPDLLSTRPLLDKLGVKPGAKVAIVNLDDQGFMTLLRTRTRDIVKGKPPSPADLVFFGADTPARPRAGSRSSRAGSSPTVRSG